MFDKLMLFTFVLLTTTMASVCSNLMLVKKNVNIEKSKKMAKAGSVALGLEICGIVLYMIYISLK